LLTANDAVICYRGQLGEAKLTVIDFSSDRPVSEGRVGM
jgi:hypothetical protein